MAHEIETIAWAGETPWHGLGTRVSNDLSTDEMLKVSGLDWNLVRKPLGFMTDDGEWFQSSQDILYRDTDEREMTIVSRDWKEVQNHEAFEFFREWVDSGNMEMHTAGSLKNGKMVWVLGKMKEDISIFGNDRIEPFLLFSLPHEYGRSIDIRFTPIRVVCNNTLTFSLGKKSEMNVKWNHRRKFDSEQVKQTLGIANSQLQEYKKTAEFLGSKRYTQENVVTYVKTIFPSFGTSETGKKIQSDKNISPPAHQVLYALEHQPGTEFAPGTWWQAFNAVTFTVDHVLGRSRDTALQSAWYGNNRIKKHQALANALEFATGA